MSNALPPLLRSLALSAALGALVGLVRQWRDQVEQPADADLGGVRTHAFWGMLGCAGAFAAVQTSPLVLAVLLGLVGLQQIVAKANAPPRARQGSTTIAAALLTVLLGCLVFWQQTTAAVLIASLAAVLVGSKPTLHGWTRGWSRVDMRAVLQFAAITGVILPLVPKADLGPFRGFNPYAIWLMVVLISAIGFVGYAAMRILGTRAGILLTSLFGGIASSTATALAFSRRSCQAKALAPQFGLAVVVACTVMFPRLLVIGSFVDRTFALRVLGPFAVMAAPGIVFSGWSWWRHRAQRGDDEPLPELANPLGLATALKFGAWYAAVSFLVKAARELGWSQSLLPLSFLSGFSSVDAIVISLAHTYADDESLRSIAVRGAILAVVGNTLLKAGIVAFVAAPATRRPVLIVLAITAIIGIALLLLPAEVLGYLSPS